MEYIKKLHETVEILETLQANCLNCLKNLMQIFTKFISSGYYPDIPKSLVIPYIVFIYCLIIILITMAHFTISNGIDTITGALKKTTEQGVNHITVTKKKHFHDPLTGEETGTGPNEIFIQNKRDYDKHPHTEKETKQLGNWTQACRDAQVILHDRSHPRFMELYHRWREHLKGPEPHKQFPPFVRSVLLSEQ